MKSKKDFMSSFAVRTRNNFTLIELLIIVAIIAILASMLLPGLNGALMKAQGIKCASNMKQCGTAFHMYAGDNNDAITLRWNGRSWSQILSGNYIDSNKARQSHLSGQYSCQSMKIDMTSSDSICNSVYAVNIQSSDYGDGGELPNILFQSGRNLSDLSNFLCLQMSRIPKQQQEFRSRKSMPDFEFFLLAEGRKNDDTHQYQNYLLNRASTSYSPNLIHNNTMNVLRYDASVTNTKLNKLRPIWGFTKKVFLNGHLNDL